MRFIVFLKKVKKEFRRIESDIKFFIYSNLFRFNRVKRTRIIFNNFNGKGFGDSPKYIATEILRQKLPYELVWVVKDNKTIVPESFKKIKTGTLKEAYTYATASVIICNSKQRLPFKKKSNQFYIQTWHGAFPLKLIEKEAEKSLSKRYIKHSKKDSAITDLMLSGSGMESRIMRSSFWYSGEILECGMPRDDIFFNQSKESINALKIKYHLPKEKKILVYAPTFRDNGNMEPYQIDLNVILEELEKKTESQWISIVRLHPNISHRSDLFVYSERIINGSFWPDPQEIFVISDFLITDYSSVMMDFGIMNKPALLYIPDFEEYQKNRGIRPLFHSLPFPANSTQKELIETIRNFDLSKYLDKLTVFKEDIYKNYSDGHASERVVERIRNVIQKIKD